MLHVLEEKLYWQERGCAENLGEYRVSSAVSAGMTGAINNRETEKMACPSLNKLFMKTKKGLMKIKDLGILNCSET